MALFLISYDIADKDAFEYDKLWAKLREMNAVRILYSEWVVIGDNSDSIYNQIAPLTLEQDRILVQELGQDAAWDQLRISDKDFKEWLKWARS